MVEIDIPDDDAGQRADRYLRKLLRQAPLALIHRLLRQGAVRSDGRRLQASDRLEPGTRLELRIDAQRLADLSGSREQGRRRPLARPQATVKVVFEDADLLVIDKPGGLAVQPGTGLGDEHLLAWLEHHLGAAPRFGSMFRPAPAHRIDRGTSGLVLIGKTAHAARALAAAFREHRVRKTYLAVVEGRPSPPAGDIDLNLSIRDRGAAASKAVPDHDGLAAQSRYRTLSGHAAGRSHSADADAAHSLAVHTLLEVAIATGRTHQIRAHLAAIGHPIAGDTRYGAHAVAHLPRGRFALHAARLELAHPTQGGLLALDAELPHDLRALLELRAADLEP